MAHDFAEAAFHVAEAVVGAGRGEFVAAAGQGGGGDAAAVIFDFEDEIFVGAAEAEPGFGGFGMFGDVVDGFFDGEKDVVADFSAEMKRRKMSGDIEAATDAREAEMFLGEFDGVSEQIFQRVVLRIYRPDDFVHGAGEFAGGAGDLADVRFGLGRAIEVGAGEFAEEGDLSEAGAEVVVDVFGDAGAFAFDGVLLFEDKHAALKLSNFDVAN